MHTSTQETPVSRRNPFEQYPKNIPPHYAGRGPAAAKSAQRLQTVRPGAANAKPHARPAALQAVSPTQRDAQARALRRQQFLRKRQFSLAAIIKRVFKLLAVALLVFILLPSSMQKRVFALVPFSAPKPVVSLPPMPVDYDYISSPFGHRWGRQHQGIDFAAAVGEPIYSTSAGTVLHSGWEPGYGKSVVVDHGHGVQTRYGHCSRLLVKEGAPVAKGAMIARVGSTGHSTGPHLHFEIIVDGVRKNPAWYFTFDNHQNSHLASAETETEERNAED